MVSHGGSHLGEVWSVQIGSAGGESYHHLFWLGDPMLGATIPHTNYQKTSNPRTWVGTLHPWCRVWRVQSRKHWVTSDTWLQGPQWHRLATTMPWERLHGGPSNHPTTLTSSLPHRGGPTGFRTRPLRDGGGRLVPPLRKETGITSIGQKIIELPTDTSGRGASGSGRAHSYMTRCLA